MPLPSVRDVISVTLDLSDELLGTMKEIDDVSTELLHRDHVRDNNIEEVPLFLFLPDLSVLTL